MDWSQALLVYSRLILGAITAFFAIVLWVKTRDIAWMLMTIGALTMYAEIVCSILELLGIMSVNTVLIGSISPVALLLPALRMAFYIAAFLILVIRQYRQKL